MSWRGPIRILIADGQPIYRLGIRTLFQQQPEFSVAGEACNGDEVLALVAGLRPDVLVLDAVLPQLNGLEVLKRLAATKSATRTVIVAAAMHEADIQTAMLHDAWGVVLKNTAMHVLPQCIKHIMKGQRWTAFSSDLKETQLTPREMDIAKRIAKGASNKDVASQLDLGEQTIKNYLRRIFRKLTVTNRLELAMQFAASDRRDQEPPAREQ